MVELTWDFFTSAATARISNPGYLALYRLFPDEENRR